VRAGRTLRPAAWKGGARCAVALSFDVDHDTNELRDGGQSIGRMAWGQFGNRVGVPRILKLLERYGVRATFYVPAVVALLYPDEQRRVIAAGHEIGVHGWIHELNSILPYEAESDLMFRSIDTLEKVSGVRPVGMRTPSWDFSPNTLTIEKEMGLAYDSSLMADEDCYELLLHGEPTGIVELPVEWIRDDAVYFSMHRFQSLRPYTPPQGVFDIWRRELEAAHADGGIFQLTMHPHVIGYRSRVWIVEELIRHAKALGNVWFATHAEIAAWARDHAADGK
jgi:peptidoglycan/xylan/chitin deacetylase (PgdA/CDA1 family)